VVAQTQGQGDEEGASLDVQGVHSDFPCGFPHHLDNILTIGELAGGEEQAGQSHPHPGGLLEEEREEGGVQETAWQRTSRGKRMVILALGEVCWDWWRARR
jgi:hypothetical protein